MSSSTQASTANAATTAQAPTPERSEAQLAEAQRITRRRVMLFAPLVVLGAAGIGFGAMLRGLTTGTYDPHGMPSQLLGKQPRPFTLPPLASSGLPSFTNADLVDIPAPILVNFWASWCIPCAIEHPQLIRLANDGVAIYGINYKDKAPGAAQGFLNERGNPFKKLDVDEAGQVAIDWGVYGVPESYLIDRKGIVRWRWAGPITDSMLTTDVRPLLRRYA